MMEMMTTGAEAGGTHKNLEQEVERLRRRVDDLERIIGDARELAMVDLRFNRVSENFFECYLGAIATCLDRADPKELLGE